MTAEQAHASRFARRLVAAYFVVQGLGTLSWWCCLLFVPGAIGWFQPQGWPDQTLLSFWLPDLSMIVAGSLIVGWAVLCQASWATTAVWSMAAAAWYATLYCIAVSLATGQAWIAAAMMSCMSGLSLAMATIHGGSQQSPATFRTTPMPPASALLWSLVQLMIFWSVFLWILPMGLEEFQRRTSGLASFEHFAQRPLAIAMFIMASAVGLSSCFVLALHGEGTPLPTANAPKFVVAGPYRFVRNPMALAGILQGLAVGWFLGSRIVIVYALLGAFAWHICVRPFEEAELFKRFGATYRNYQQAVRLWIPLPREPFR